MKIKYDQQIDAKYITLKKGKVACTKPINEWLFFDLNAKDEVIGVEILDASKNRIDLHTDGSNLVAVTFEPIEMITKEPQYTFFNQPLFRNEKKIEDVLAHAY